MTCLFIVDQAVTDLRKQPTQFLPTLKPDPLQETQLLWGESFKVIKEAEAWLYGEAIEQPYYCHIEGWQGYRGWVQKSHVVKIEQIPLVNARVNVLWTAVYPVISDSLLLNLSFGTGVEIIEKKGKWSIVKWLEGQKGRILSDTLQPLSLKKKEDSQIKALAKIWLDAPYAWGGRSAYQANLTTGLTSTDCSGFIHLLYCVLGINIPRNAHDQFLSCKPITGAELQLGNLIFQADVNKPDRMSHVMVYLGEDQFSDANLTDHKVVMTTAKRRFGKSFAAMQVQEELQNKIFYFGALF